MVPLCPCRQRFAPVPPPHHPGPSAAAAGPQHATHTGSVVVSLQMLLISPAQVACTAHLQLGNLLPQPLHLVHSPICYGGRRRVSGCHAAHQAVPWTSPKRWPKTSGQVKGSVSLPSGMHNQSGRPERAQLLSKTPYEPLGKQQAGQVHTVTDHGSLAGTCPAELACGALGEVGFWHEAPMGCFVCC